MGASGACAVIWDFDGTLVDSRQKNLNVTRSIIEKVTGQSAIRFNALSSIASYEEAIARTANWRELYYHEFDLSERDIDHAGQLWTEYQLQDDTATPVFAGIAEVLKQLQYLPHGILSQNGKAVISGVLETNKLASYFKVVIGYEEVDFQLQKPAPEGLLRCLEILTNLKPGYVFYIGDHETDALCAVEGRKALARHKLSIEVISIGALYGTELRSSGTRGFDHIAPRPSDIADIVESHIQG